MMIGVQVVNLHIRVQGALMFFKHQTKSPRKASPKDNLRAFKRILGCSLGGLERVG